MSRSFGRRLTPDSYRDRLQILVLGNKNLPVWEHTSKINPDSYRELIKNLQSDLLIGALLNTIGRAVWSSFGPLSQKDFHFQNLQGGVSNLLKLVKFIQSVFLSRRDSILVEI